MIEWLHPIGTKAPPLVGALGDGHFARFIVLFARGYIDKEVVWISKSLSVEYIT